VTHIPDEFGSVVAHTGRPTLLNILCGLNRSSSPKVVGSTEVTVVSLHHQQYVLYRQVGASPHAA